jgi:photosystem II stability/assembly factor-like uncharacterized protein
MTFQLIISMELHKKTSIMKKFLRLRLTLILVSTALLINSAFTQGWEQVYSGSDMFMRDICFVPGDDGLWETGWAISFEGDIIKTTDGGDTWIEIGQSISTSLAGISFADETTGYIATLDNKVLKSTDGGLTWSTVYNGGQNFDKVAVEDEDNLVASGTAKLYSSDGGTTWSTGTGGSNYWDLDHASGSTYFGISLGGSLGQSTDGGATWTDMASLGAMGFMTKFMDETHGMFGGDLSTIKVTHDGGSNWTTNTLGGGQDVLNTGGFFDPDTIYAAGSSGEIFKTTDGGVSWSTDTSWSSGAFQPRGMVVTGMNVVFATGQNSSSDGLIWRKIGAPPIDADFEASETVVCAGSSVDFTDLSYGAVDSWSWSFEGGAPATSTDQNPTVTYSTTGKFDVKLVVTVGAIVDSLTKADYIHVVELPDQAGTPEGDDEACTGMSHVYTVDPVQYGHTYEWEVSPADAGTLTWNMHEATLEVADAWTGDFTIRVRAANVCGDGDWSDNFEGTVYQSPSEFNVTGGGGYCLGGDGVEIGLDGSETGVDYELYLDGSPAGIVVSGTGSEISFGNQVDEGYYSVVGYSDYCSRYMTGQEQVFIEFPPLEPDTPEGPDVICEESSSDYTSEGDDDADEYIWLLSPGEAGTISYDGLEATVDWDPDFYGTAYISLYGINECGDGNPSNELEVSVGAPVPVVDGEALVCDWSDEIYTAVENEGSTYTWEVTGGVITDGQGTYMITISWEGEGDGTVSVEEETADGCSGSSAEFEVMIDDCTGLQESSILGELKLYPNPAGNTLNVAFNSSSVTNANISILNHLGQVVMTVDETVTEGSQQLSIDISNLHPGIYVMTIQDDRGEVSRKQFIKK